VESGYFACLSAASVNSLNVQGGPMNEDEIDKFEKYACKKLSVKVRKWDDAAKVVGMSTPPFSHYVPVLERVLITREK
jgi:predicted HD phosphohydrolase